MDFIGLFTVLATAVAAATGVYNVIANRVDKKSACVTACFVKAGKSCWVLRLTNSGKHAARNVSFTVEKGHVGLFGEKTIASIAPGAVFDIPATLYENTGRSVEIVIQYSDGRCNPQTVRMSVSTSC